MARHNGQGHGGGRWSQPMRFGLPNKHEGDEFLEVNNPELFPQDADSGFADAERRANTAERLDAYSEVFSPADVGRFIRPARNYWANHKAVVLAGAPFDPTHYPFDKMVAKYADLPMVFDPKNRHYAEHAGARLNLAVLRNYLGNHFYPDGPTGDEMKDLKNRNRLNQVAIEVGDMLHRGGSVLPSFGRSLSPRSIGAEGVGAARLYTKLLGAQRHEHLVGPFLAPIRFFQGKMDRDWRLPPLSETPFHPRNVHPSGQAALHGASPILAGDDVFAVSPEEIDFGTLGPLAMAGFANVDDLDDPVKQRAIELAREILKNWRIQFGDIPVAAMLDRLDGDAAKALFGQLDTLTATFQAHLPPGGAVDPEDREIGNAFTALGMLAHQSLRFALRGAELPVGQGGDPAKAEAIRAQIEALPANWREPGALTLGQLSTAMKRGLEKLVERQTVEYGSSDGGGLGQARAVLAHADLPVAAMAMGTGQPQQPNQAAAQAAARQAETFHQQQQRRQQLVEQTPTRPAKPLPLPADPTSRDTATQKPGKPFKLKHLFGGVKKPFFVSATLPIDPVKADRMKAPRIEPLPVAATPVKAPKIVPPKIEVLGMISPADLQRMQGMMVAGDGPVMSPKRPTDHFKNAAPKPDRKDPLSPDGPRQR